MLKKWYKKVEPKRLFHKVPLEIRRLIISYLDTRDTNQLVALSKKQSRLLKPIFDLQALLYAIVWADAKNMVRRQSLSIIQKNPELLFKTGQVIKTFYSKWSAVQKSPSAEEEELPPVEKLHIDLKFHAEWEPVHQVYYDVSPLQLLIFLGDFILLERVLPWIHPKNKLRVLEQMDKLKYGGADLVKIDRDPRLLPYKKLTLLENPNGIVLYKDQNKEYWYYLHVNHEKGIIEAIELILIEELYLKDPEFLAFRATFDNMEMNSSRRSSNDERQLIKKYMDRTLIHQGITYKQKGLLYQDIKALSMVAHCYRRWERISNDLENWEQDQTCQNAASSLIESTLLAPAHESTFEIQDLWRQDSIAKTCKSHCTFTMYNRSYLLTTVDESSDYLGDYLTYLKKYNQIKSNRLVNIKNYLKQLSFPQPMHWLELTTKVSLPQVFFLMLYGRVSLKSVMDSIQIKWENSKSFREVDVSTDSTVRHIKETPYIKAWNKLSQYYNINENNEFSRVLWLTLFSTPKPMELVTALVFANKLFPFSTLPINKFFIINLGKIEKYLKEYQQTLYSLESYDNVPPYFDENELLSSLTQDQISLKQLFQISIQVNEQSEPSTENITSNIELNRNGLAYLFFVASHENPSIVVKLIAQLYEYNLLDKIQDRLHLFSPEFINDIFAPICSVQDDKLELNQKNKILNALLNWWQDQQERNFLSDTEFCDNSFIKDLLYVALKRNIYDIKHLDKILCNASFFETVIWQNLPHLPYDEAQFYIEKANIALNYECQRVLEMIPNECREWFLSPNGYSDSALFQKCTHKEESQNIRHFKNAVIRWILNNTMGVNSYILLRQEIGKMLISDIDKAVKTNNPSRILEKMDTEIKPNKSSDWEDEKLQEWYGKSLHSQPIEQFLDQFFKNKIKDKSADGITRLRKEALELFQQDKLLLKEALSNYRYNRYKSYMVVIKLIGFYLVSISLMIFFLSRLDILKQKTINDSLIDRPLIKQFKEKPTFRGLTAESSDFAETMDPAVKPREVELAEFRKNQETNQYLKYGYRMWGVNNPIKQLNYPTKKQLDDSNSEDQPDICSQKNPFA